MRRLRHTQKYHLVNAVVLAVGCGIIGAFLLHGSHAATTTVSLEAEQGSSTGAATAVNDASASGGKAVRFQESAPPSGQMNIYVGSTHDHTGCCNNHGETNKATVAQDFAAAKANKVNHFDFLFLTEHSGHSGPVSMGLDPAAFYADVKAQAAKYTDSTFVGVPGIEFSDNDGSTADGGKGHMTAANIDTFMSADGTTVGAADLEDHLARQAAAGDPAYGGFNHPGPEGGAGSVAGMLTPARRNVIVMSEIFNSYENSTNDAGNYQGWIAELDRGWRLAPTCGLDGHGIFRLSDTRVNIGACRVGVLMPSLTKANLDAAFLARRIYASRDVDLHLSYTVNGQWMGSQIGNPASLTFDITANDPDTGRATDKITRMDIVTDGDAVVTSKTFSGYDASWNVTVPANNKKYYFVRVYDNERTTFTAAGAPVWLEPAGS